MKKKNSIFLKTLLKRKNKSAINTLQYSFKIRLGKSTRYSTNSGLDPIKLRTVNDTMKHKKFSCKKISRLVLKVYLILKNIN